MNKLPESRSTAKAILRRKLISIQVHIKKQGKTNKET